MTDNEKGKQLERFAASLEDFSGEAVSVPENWYKAFDILKAYLRTVKSEKKVVFIDEMPWLDTEGSDFVDDRQTPWRQGRHSVLLEADEPQMDTCEEYRFDVFQEKGLLWDEFDHLFNTLFKKADTYIAVVEALSRKRMGMIRKELVKETGDWEFR